MKTVQIIKTVLTAVMLVWVVGGCSSKEIHQETIETESAKEVSYKAPIEAISYRWRQLSGIEVRIDDSSSRILRFSAPKVSKEERLRFELEAWHDEHYIERMLLSVIVSASPSDTLEDNATTGRGDTTTTTTPTVTLESLNLTVDKTSLNRDENTTVKVMATYADNSTQEITDKVQWIITPKDAIRIEGAILTALQDKATTLKAKLNGKTSNAIDLNITWTVNGHTLPPEPDKALNDSTLLGIDVNNNGVRDDVERWIYKKYKNKHPIYIDIAMQAARGYRLVLEHPERAKEIYPVLDATTWCEGYYKIYAKYFNEPILVKDDISTKFFREKIYFNTKERMAAYIKYDTLLSGDSYSTPAVDKNMSSYCDFNISKYGE